MRWIGESVGARKVRNRDMNPSAVLRYAVYFFHDSKNIMKMFDDVVSINGPEGVMRKWPWRLVEVMNYIRRRLCCPVKVYGIFHSFSPTAQVQDVRLTERL